MFFSFNKVIILAFIIMLFFIMISPLETVSSKINAVTNHLTTQATIVVPQFIDMTASSNLFIAHSQRGDKLSALDEALGVLPNKGTKRDIGF